MRILIITQWFDPEPTFKGMLFARELASRGHEIEVITGFPNYPGGRLYPGYRIRPWRVERSGNIRVIRVPLYPSHDRSSLRRVANYISFALSASTIGILLAKKPDVVYVYCPPATAALPAMLLHLLRRIPFVFDIQDLWPDTVATSRMLSNEMAIRLLQGWCNFVYRCASRIAVLSPGFKEKLIERGVPSAKINVVYNWCDEDMLRTPCLQAEELSNLRLAEHFNVIFAGTMGTAQGLDAVLDAAAICKQTTPRVEFIFVGGGVEREKLEHKAADEMRLSNVRFLPQQPMLTIGALLNVADVLLVHLKDDPLFAITIPSKTQAYLALGKPIVMAVRGDAAELVSRSGGGLVCEPGSPKSIAEAVRQLVEMKPEERLAMGRAGRAYYDEFLSLKSGASEFEAIFRRCVSLSRDARPVPA